MSDLIIAAIAGFSAFALALLSKPSEQERLEQAKRKLDRKYDFAEQIPVGDDRERVFTSTRREEH